MQSGEQSVSTASLLHGRTILFITLFGLLIAGGIYMFVLQEKRNTEIDTGSGTGSGTGANTGTGTKTGTGTGTKTGTGTGTKTGTGTETGTGTGTGTSVSFDYNQLPGRYIGSIGGVATVLTISAVSAGSSYLAIYLTPSQNDAATPLGIMNYDQRLGVLGNTTENFTWNGSYQMIANVVPNTFYKAIDPGVPAAPVITAANITGDSVSVAFEKPPSDGGDPITRYTVNSFPTGITASGSSSPITVSVSGKTGEYVFNVAATNFYGTGLPSDYSSKISTLAAPTVSVSTTQTDVIRVICPNIPNASRFTVRAYNVGVAPPQYPWLPPNNNVFQPDDVAADAVPYTTTPVDVLVPWGVYWAFDYVVTTPAGISVRSNKSAKIQGATVYSS
jgi:hypothetical protein